MSINAFERSIMKDLLLVVFVAWLTAVSICKLPNSFVWSFKIKGFSSLLMSTSLKKISKGISVKPIMHSMNNLFPTYVYLLVLMLSPYISRICRFASSIVWVGLCSHIVWSCSLYLPQSLTIVSSPIKDEFNGWSPKCCGSFSSLGGLSRWRGRIWFLF